MNKYIFLIAILITASLQQQCSQSSSSDLLQSGSVTLYNANSGTRQHIYTFPITFTPSSNGIKIAASASSMQYFANSGLDFSIIGSVASNSALGTILLLMSEDNSWTNIRVSYLASSRSDFYLGTFSAVIYLQQQSSNSGPISIIQAIPNWTSNQNSYNSVVDIAGVRTSAASFLLSVSSSSFNPSTGTLTTQVSLSSSPIQLVYLTYVIFLTSSPITYSSFNVNSATTSTYQFIGLSQLANINPVYAGAGFNSQAQNQINCLGSNCPSQCISPQACTAYNGQIYGGACLICGSGQIVSNGNCVTSSQLCGSNQYYNGSACVCYQGYLLVNSVCYPSCGPNAYVINSQCTCLPGYTYSNYVNQCVLPNTVTCGANFVVVGGQCVCPLPFGLINSLCVSCPVNTVVSNGNCQCNSGYTLNPSTFVCIANCYANAYLNAQGTCVCNSGFVFNGLSCIQSYNCLTGQTWNGNSCVCSSGQYLDSLSNSCSYCNTPDRMVSNNACVCSPTYYVSGTSCVPCMANAIYNSTSSRCACFTGFYLSAGQCLRNNQNCPYNAIWNPNSGTCICNSAGQYVVNGYCQPCVLYSSWNGTACACNSGYTMQNSICIFSCPANSVYSLTSFTCVCNSGYLINNNFCASCDSNSVYVPAQKTCICNSGWFGTYNQCSQCDPSCLTCSGPGRNQCVTCPSNIVINNGFCSGSAAGCSSGFYVGPNNNCQPCMANCGLCYSANICSTCNQGYSQNVYASGSTILMSCTLIPTGTTSTLSLRGNVIGNKVVYQGIALSLMPTSILALNCNICNNLFTVNTVSNFATITNTVEYVANSQYWFVITFDFGSVPFIPTFQFTVQINPTYASYFSAADMAQKVGTSISSTSLTSFSAIIPAGARIYTSGNSINKSSPTVTATASATDTTTSTSKSVPDALLAKMFPSTS